MQHVISDLVTHFERGRLSRRELIQSLTAYRCGSGNDGVSRLAEVWEHQSHVGARERHGALDRLLQPRVRPLGHERGQSRTRFRAWGSAAKCSCPLRVEPPPAGQIDHFAIGVEGFNRDAVTKEPEEMGLTPQENLEFGFHVKDPDGANVQITGI